MCTMLTFALGRQLSAAFLPGLVVFLPAGVHHHLFNPFKRPEVRALMHKLEPGQTVFFPARCSGQTRFSYNKNSRFQATKF